MEIIRSKKALKEAIRGLRRQGKTIGLIPTMGALHAGHISLVKLARSHAEVAVATVFVNPTQFGPNEDFTKYPRTEAEDLKKLEEAGVGIAYLPTVEEMYPEGAVTRVQVPGIREELCGAFRPGHFDGVATIVTKLLLQAEPDVAIFGEKDYQQLHIIKQVVRDLDIPVRVIGAPVMREPDGLAMSSRNRYLNEKERTTAPLLYKVLKETADNIRRHYRESGNLPVLLLKAKKTLLSAGFSKVDYIELRDSETLKPIVVPTQAVIVSPSPARLLAAVYLGSTRLIDNVTV